MSFKCLAMDTRRGKALKKHSKSKHKNCLFATAYFSMFLYWWIWAWLAFKMNLKAIHRRCIMDNNKHSKSSQTKQLFILTGFTVFLIILNTMVMNLLKGNSLIS